MPPHESRLIHQDGLDAKGHPGVPVVRPEGLEPPHPAPEAGALSN